MIILIISRLSTVTWLLPPFRQYKTKYFLFFLIMALIEPSMLLLTNLFHLGFTFLAPIFSLLLIYSLIERNTKSTLVILVSVVIFMIAFGHLNDFQNRILLLLLHIIILVLLIYDLMLVVASKNALNLFLILLIAYEVTVIYKFMARVFDIHNGIVIYFLSTFIELFFGVLFTIYNVNSKNFRIFKKLDTDYNQE